MNKIKKISIFLCFLFFLVFFNIADAKDLNGKFWLNVEDKGRIWYVNPTDSAKYEITTSNAFNIFSQVAKEISTKDLSNISKLNQYKGYIVFDRTSEKYYYIDKSARKYEFSVKNLLQTLKKVSTGIKNKDLFQNEKTTSLSITLSPNISTNDQYLNKIIDVWNLLKQKYANTIDLEKASQGAIDGLLKTTGDDYTTFFSATSSESFLDDLNGNFEGIGIEIDNKDNIITILGILKDTPAQSAGLKPGDVITAIDGKSTDNMSLENVSKLIRGKAGTDVTLKILRNSLSYDIKVTRGAIHYDIVSSEILDNNIAYVKIKSFGADSSDLMNKIADELVAKNVKAIVLDLRGNPGGYLDSAVSIAGLWIDNNIVVREKIKDQFEPKNILTSTTPKLKNIKTVALVNRGSASASEIVAGAFQDYGIAKIVGEKTYGKGSVQEMDTLSDGSSVKITVAQWFTPLGRTIDKIGITPDIEIVNDLSSGIDSQLNKALELLK